VREAVVIPREDVPGDVRLVAYLVAADPDAEPSSRELKEYLREHLPEAMVPSHFIVLERFPQTPNKKIDRKALPAPMDAAPRAKTGEAGGAPASELEAKVLAVWQEVLQLPQIDIEDNFFDLGGHSLLAVKVLPHGAFAGPPPRGQRSRLVESGGHRPGCVASGRAGNKADRSGPVVVLEFPRTSLSSCRIDTASSGWIACARGRRSTRLTRSRQLGLLRRDDRQNSVVGELCDERSPVMAPSAATE
jgi:hypothetical protein